MARTRHHIFYVVVFRLHRRLHLGVFTPVAHNGIEVVGMPAFWQLAAAVCATSSELFPNIGALSLGKFHGVVLPISAAALTIARRVAA